MPIIDGARNFQTDSPWPVVAGCRAAQLAGFLPPPVETTGGPSVRARVYRNQWIADCPDCGGAQFIWRAGPLVTICLSCLNDGVGHVWRPVVLPDDVAAIEDALLARPRAQNRNWHSVETVADLLRENAENGV